MNDKSVAVVTGGNRGMGLATCKVLAERGYHVLLGCRNLENGEQAARDLREKELSVEAVKLDVASLEDINALAIYLSDKHGRVDVLINNAGILIDGQLGEAASICDASADTLKKCFEVNTVGPVMLINALLPLMRQSGSANIVNISSGMGQLSDMGGQYAGYRISKTALNAVTAIFAAELEGSGITINAVCPGWVRTDMGGSNAERTLEEGVDTTIWLATSGDNQQSGGFYRDRQLIDW